MLDSVDPTAGGNDAAPSPATPPAATADEPAEILWMHPNGIWYILYGLRHKKRISTRSRDRAEAEQELNAFRLGRAAAVTMGQTVGDILRGYEADRKAEVQSPGSLKYSVQPLQQHLGSLYPAQLIRPVIRAYADERKKPPTPEAIERNRRFKRRPPKAADNGTILREIGVLRAALEWALQSGIIKNYPKISNPVPTPPPKERWLTKDEARKLLAECLEPHLKAFVVLGLMTAARSGAILELPWSRVLWDHNLIDYGKGHGNKHRAVVPMNPELRRFLESYRELACTEFVIERHGKPVKSVKNGLDAACARAGLNGVTGHTFRHTSATWMALAGVPMREIARVLADSEATAEKVYAKYHPDYLRSATGALVLNPAAAGQARPQPWEALSL